jgi:hypothetical protein
VTSLLIAGKQVDSLSLEPGSQLHRIMVKAYERLRQRGVPSAPRGAGAALETMRRRNLLDERSKPEPLRQRRRRAA